MNRAVQLPSGTPSDGQVGKRTPGILGVETGSGVRDPLDLRCELSVLMGVLIDVIGGAVAGDHAGQHGVELPRVGNVAAVQIHGWHGVLNVVVERNQAAHARADDGYSSVVVIVFVEVGVEVRSAEQKGVLILHPGHLVR